MGRKLEITEKIKAAIIKSTSDQTFDFSKVSVFETACFSTLPVKKRGLLHMARATEQTLHEMAAFAAGGGFVPMHTLHAQGYELPVGRIFYAEVRNDANGIPRLHAQFFIGNEHDKLVAGVDNGSIDEVSVGVTTKHANCSVCGWDYLGAEAGPEHIYGQVCANGHEIGTDGTHVILSTLDTWLETSLVSLGAAQNAKILSRTKALLGAERYDTLLASGVNPEATVLFASSPLSIEKQESTKMEIKELVTLNASLTADKAVADHKVKVAEETVVKLNAEITTLQTKVSELTAKVNPDHEKTAAALTAAQDQLKAATAVLRAESDRLAVAAGAEKLPEAATVAELTAAIDANRAKLAATFGQDGKSLEASAGTQKAAEAAPANSIYKTR